MAEAWLEEEEEELRELRDSGNRRHRRGHLNPAPERSERNKPEQRLSSQGPLSSIRAAIKRTTSTRIATQTEQQRDRRRPEITIVSAEPLGPASWIQGVPGGCPSSAALGFPPPAPTVWGPNLPTSAQLPPSYDQVIKEKNQEQNSTTATNATHRPSTATIATQTEPDENPGTTSSESNVINVVDHGEPFSASGRLSKPLRPSLLPSAVQKPLAVPQESSLTVPIPNDSSLTDNPTELTNSQAVLDPASLPEVSSHCESVEPPDKQEVVVRRPVPRPRSMINLKSHAKIEQVPVLVEVNEKSSSCTQDNILLTQNKHLQDLLEVFGPEAQFDPNMSTHESQRNIRAKIQAFESQANLEVGTSDLSNRPEIAPRTFVPKPPVTTAKPSIAPKPSARASEEIPPWKETKSIMAPWEEPALVLPKMEDREASFSCKPELPKKPKSQIFATGSTNGNDFLENRQQEERKFPVPAPRPVVLKKPESKNSLASQQQAVVIPAPRMSVLARAKNFQAIEEGPAARTRSSSDLISFDDDNCGLVTSAVKNGVESRISNTGDFNFTEAESIADTQAQQKVFRKPTVIRIPSKPNGTDADDQAPPPLPTQRPIGAFSASIPRKPDIPSKVREEEDNSFDTPVRPRLKGPKVLPFRPPPPKGAPARPPPPKTSAPMRRSSSETMFNRPSSTRPQSLMLTKKGPSLPPRPAPGHPLYTNYTLALPHGVAERDHHSRIPGELSFQKKEVLVLLQQIDSNYFECQVGDKKGKVHKSHMKIITPLKSEESNRRYSQGSYSDGMDYQYQGQQAEVLHDFISEQPDDLTLKTGDTVSILGKIDNDWFSGTCRGRTGIFPVSFVRVIADNPGTAKRKSFSSSSAFISGPRCKARFDFEGEQADELTLAEGDVIKLHEYVDEEWAKGELRGQIGIFPLNYVEIIEDLPSSSQSKSTSSGVFVLPKSKQESIKKEQLDQQWCVAVYDFIGQSDEDLTFYKGDCIQIIEHIDSEWLRGRLGGKEGIFPAVFVEYTKGPDGGESGKPRRAKALFDFMAEDDEELSFRAGDIIAAVEAVDGEWFSGQLHGKTGLFPKNYVTLL
ncbi:SH3 domain-containing protein 19 isoform X1 [Polypterus senegalus]